MIQKVWVVLHYMADGTYPDVFTTSTKAHSGVLSIIKENADWDSFSLEDKAALEKAINDNNVDEAEKLYKKLSGERFEISRVDLDRF